MFLRRKRTNTISVGSSKKINDNGMGGGDDKCATSFDKTTTSLMAGSCEKAQSLPISQHQQEGATEIFTNGSSHTTSSMVCLSNSITSSTNKSSNSTTINNNNTTNTSSMISCSNLIPSSSSSSSILIDKKEKEINILKQNTTTVFNPSQPPIQQQSANNNNKNNNQQQNNNNNNQNQKQLIKSIIKKLSLTFSQKKKKKEFDPKIQEFLRMIDVHKEFFKKAPEIDKYIITLSYILLNKAYPSFTTISNELFFHSLYLAWETEEDSTLGLESIIHYVIGSYPSRNKEKNQRKQEIQEWRMRLRNFHAGKDILWRDLDFRTLVEFPVIAKTTKSFPNHDILKRDRPYSQSIKFF